MKFATAERIARLQTTNLAWMRHQTMKNPYLESDEDEIYDEEENHPGSSASLFRKPPPSSPLVPPPRLGLRPLLKDENKSNVV